MTEISSYELTKSILEEFSKEDKKVDDDLFINKNLLEKIIIVSSMLDKTSVCSECLELKERILILNDKLTDVINFPKENFEIQKKYLKFLSEFSEHFHSSHNTLEEIINNNYRTCMYNGLEMIHNLEIEKNDKIIKKIDKNFDYEYLQIAFSWIDERYEKDKKKFKDLKEDTLKFIYKLYKEKKCKNANDDYLDMVSKVVKLISEERKQYLEGKNNSYDLYSDLYLRMKGLDIVENKNKNINYQYMQNGKYFYRLTSIAQNIEESKEKCNYCRQLKEKIIPLLDELELIKSKKKNKLSAYKKFYKKHKDIIKEYKAHYKNQHNKIDIETIDKIVFWPLTLLIGAGIVAFSISIENNYNLSGEFILYPLTIIFILNFKKIQIKILKLISKTRDIF